MGWRRYSDAADAYGQAIRLLGDSAKRLSGQGQALVLANNGVVTEEARPALERAVELDQTLHRAAHPARHRQGAGRTVSGGDRGLAGAARQGAGKMRPGARWWRSGSPPTKRILRESPWPRPKALRRKSRVRQSEEGPSASDVAAAQNYESRRAAGDDRKHGAGVLPPSSTRTAAIFPAGSSWCAPIACSTGRTMR